MEWKLVKGTSDSPFFEVNPDLRYYPVIKRLIKKYGEDNAGKIMWAIHMTEDISGSFYGMDVDEKRDMVGKTFLEDIPKFDWEDVTVEEVINKYPEMSMPPKKRRYKRLQDSFDLLLKELEGGTDNTLAISRLQGVLKKAEEEWLDEALTLESTQGSKQANIFWGKQKS